MSLRIKPERSLLDGTLRDEDGIPMIGAIDTDTGQEVYANVFQVVDEMIGCEEITSIEMDGDVVRAIHFGNGRVLRPKCCCCGGDLKAKRKAPKVLVGARLEGLSLAADEQGKPVGINLHLEKGGQTDALCIRLDALYSLAE